MKRAISAALAMCALAAPAAAQTAPAENDIVVTGRRLGELAREFSGVVSSPPAREDQLGRFDGAICAGVLGVGQRQGQYIVDRISQRGAALGLHPAGPGCEADILVIVTHDAEGVARALAEDERYYMANTRMRENIATRGEAALNDFITAPRPVRWWHVAQTQTEDGQTLGDTVVWGEMTGMNAQIFHGAEVARVSPNRFGRISRKTRQDFRNVVIIVDADRAAGPTLQALADYISMVAYAQMDPDADTTSYPTILNLFSPSGVSMTALTAWDEAYLQGLYDAPATAPDHRTQERAITRTMTEELSPTRH